MYIRSVNLFSRLAELADCKRVLREGGPADGVATLDCVLRDIWLNAMCGVVHFWIEHIRGVAIFITCVRDCAVVVGACGCTFGTYVGVEVVSGCVML